MPTIQTFLPPLVEWVYLTNFVEGENINVGDVAMLGRNGRLAEIVRIDEFDLATGRFKIARGCYDTIPKQWAAGTPFWFYRNYNVNDTREYGHGELIDTKVLTHAGPNVLIPGLSTTMRIEMDSRIRRPYAPGMLRFNGVPWYTGVSLTSTSGPINITWTHRDRVMQQDRTIDHSAGNIGPEPGSTYTIDIIGQDGEIAHSITGITGTSYTLTHALVSGLFMGAPGTPFPVYLEIYTMREGWDAWQHYEGRLLVTTEGLGVKQLARVLAARVVLGDDGMLPQPEDFATPAFHVAHEEPYIERLIAQRTAPMDLSIIDITAARFTSSADSYLAFINPSLTDISGTVPGLWAPAAEVAGWPLTEVSVGGKPQKIGSLITPYTTAFWLRDVQQRGGLVVGALGLLMPLAGTSDMRQQSEIVRITEVHLNQQYIRVDRGCMDTVPHAFGQMCALLIFRPRTVTNGVYYDQGTRLYEGIAPVPGSTQPVQIDSITADARAVRPYPPGFYRINGNPWFNENFLYENGALALTWEDRNRVDQGLTIKDHFAIDCTREPGTEYVLVFTALGSVFELTATTSEGRSFTYDESVTLRRLARAALQTRDPAYIPLLPGQMERGTLTLFSRRAGWESWQQYTTNLRMAVEVELFEPQPPANYRLRTLPYELPYPEVLRNALPAITPRQGYVGSATVAPTFNSDGYKLDVQDTEITIEGNSFLRGTVGPRELGVVSGTYVRALQVSRWPAVPTALPDGTNIMSGGTIVQLSEEFYFIGPAPAVGDVLMLGKEFILVTEVNAGTSYFRADRGCFDTIPKVHAPGAEALFYRDSMAIHGAHRYPWRVQEWPIAMLGGQTLSTTSPPYEVWMAHRAARPLPPGQARNGAAPWFTIARVIGDHTFSWVGRNRLSQGTNAIGHLIAEIPDEPGTTYRLQFILSVNGTSFAVRTVYGITAHTLTYTAWMAFADRAAANVLRNQILPPGTPRSKPTDRVTLTVRLEAVRDGMASWEPYDMRVSIELPVDKPPKPPVPDPGDPGWTPPGGNQPGTNPPPVPTDPNGPSPGDPQDPGPYPDPNNPDSGGPELPDEDNPNNPNNPEEDDDDPYGWGLNFSRRWGEGTF